MIPFSWRKIPRDEDRKTKKGKGMLTKVCNESKNIIKHIFTLLGCTLNGKP
jgi:hypothetical protein